MGRGIILLASVVVSVRSLGLLGADVAVTTAVSRHLIRSNGHIVQDRPSVSVRWADIPQLSMRVRVLSTVRAAVLAAVEQRALPFYSSNSFLSRERLHR
jgi:hypothetical protein